MTRVGEGDLYAILRRKSLEAGDPNYIMSLSAERERNSSSASPRMKRLAGPGSETVRSLRWAGFLMFSGPRYAFGDGMERQRTAGRPDVPAIDGCL